MPQNNPLPKALTRFLSIKENAVNDTTRTVHVSFSSEKPYKRFFGDEILLHDDEAINLQRLKSNGVALFNHNMDYILGKLENIKIDTQKRRAGCDILFDDDNDTEKIYKKIQKGILKGISVGYSVEEWEEVKAGETSQNGRFIGPCFIAKKWTPYEVSVVSVPADDSVGINRHFIHDNKTFIKGAKVMTPEEIKAALKQLQKEEESSEKDKKIEELEQELQNLKNDTDSKVEEEKKRIYEVQSLCRAHNLNFENLKEKSVNDVKDIALKARTEQMQALPASVNIRITAAEEDKLRDAMTDAMLMRAGFVVNKPVVGSQDFRGMGLKRLAIESLIRSGESNAHRLNDEDLFKKALTPGSAFVSITDNIIDKTMKEYATPSTTYQIWTGRGSVSDYKTAKHYRLSEAGKLEPVPENSGFQYDELSDEGISKRVINYGKSFGLTFESFVNDDLDVITRIPLRYTRGAYQTVNELVYKALTSSTNIYDNKPLFCDVHKNIAATGSALSTESLSKAVAAMKKQKGTNNKGPALNIAPQFLICGVDVEAQAAQLLKSTADPQANNAGVVNIYQNSLTLVPDASLEGNAWYLAANPLDCDTIEVTYLNGYDTPILESKDDFDRLGRKYRIWYPVGVAALDYRGLYKNPGAVA